MTTKPGKPAEWRNVLFEDICDIIGGYAFKSVLMSKTKEKYQIVKMSNLYNNRLDLTRSPSYLVDIGEKEKKYLLQNGDILISLTGTIGKRDYGYTVQISKEPDLLANQRLGLLRAKKLVSSKFLFHKVKHYSFQDQFFDISKGGTGNQTNVSTSSLKIIPLVIPSLSEQEKIVEILETSDSYIEELTKTIRLRKKFKKGLVQKLLTGKLRLPGFNGEWQNHEIGELLDYEQPSKYIVSDTNYSDSNKTPVLTAGKSFILGYTDETEGLCTDLPVIIFDDFTTANKYVDFEFKVKSSAMKMLISKDVRKFNLKFIYERMQLISFAAGEHKRKYLSEYQYVSIKIPDIEEQTAIAKILTTADQEIEALERRKELIEDQKKFLLNNLITGKIRLPEFST